MFGICVCFYSLTFQKLSVRNLLNDLRFTITYRLLYQNFCLMVYDSKTQWFTFVIYIYIYIYLSNYIKTIIQTAVSHMKCKISCDCQWVTVYYNSEQKFRF